MSNVDFTELPIGNRIGAVGLECMSEALKFNSTLTELDISGMQINYNMKAKIFINSMTNSEQCGRRRSEIFERNINNQHYPHSTEFKLYVNE